MGTKKRLPRSGSVSKRPEAHPFLVLAALAITLEAVAAINGTIATGLERHLGSRATTVADHFIHLTLATAGVLSRTTRRPASGATGGVVLKALIREELLLACGEYELSATVAARQGFVLIHDGSLQNCYSVSQAIRDQGYRVSRHSDIDERRRENRNLIPRLGQRVYYSMASDFCIPVLAKMLLYKALRAWRTTLCTRRENAISRQHKRLIDTFQNVRHPVYCKVFPCILRGAM